MQQEKWKPEMIAEDSATSPENDHLELSPHPTDQVLTSAPRQHKRVGSQRIENESLIIQDPVIEIVTRGVNSKSTDFGEQKVLLPPLENNHLRSSSLSSSQSQQRSIQRLLENNSQPIEENLRTTYKKAGTLADKLTVIQYAVTYFWQQAIFTRASIYTLVERHPEPNLYGWNHKFHALFDQVSQANEQLYIAEQVQEFWSGLLSRGKKPYQNPKIYDFGVTEWQQWTQRFRALSSPTSQHHESSFAFPSDEKAIVTDDLDPATIESQDNAPDFSSTLFPWQHNPRVTVEEMLKGPSEVSLTPPLKFPQILENAYGSASTLEQKIKVMTEAIEYFYPKSTHVLPTEAFRFIQTPFHPGRELQRWIQRLDQLYNSVNSNPHDQLELITVAHLCWLKLESASTPEKQEEKSHFFRSATKEKLNPVLRDNSEEDIRSLSSQSSESKENSSATPSPRENIAGHELEKWHQRLLALKDSSPTSTSSSCCCLIS